ncbi:hypothetical protein SK128_000408, partial [Halocaridina rubra]
MTLCEESRHGFGISFPVDSKELRPIIYHHPQGSVPGPPEGGICIVYKAPYGLHIEGSKKIERCTVKKARPLSKDGLAQFTFVMEVLHLGSEGQSAIDVYPQVEVPGNP